MVEKQEKKRCKVYINVEVKDWDAGMGRRDFVWKRRRDRQGWKVRLRAITGGRERRDSVRQGTLALGMARQSKGRHRLSNVT